MKRALSTILLALSLTACGENFSGNYVGTALVDPSGCGGNRDTYQVTLRGIFSDGSLRLELLYMINASGQSNDINYTEMSGSFATASLQANSAFSVADQQIKDGIFVSMSGSASATRDRIDNVQMVHKKTNQDGSPCIMQLIGQVPFQKQ